VVHLRLRPPTESELGTNSGIEVFDCAKRVIQVRKETGEKRSFAFDSLLEPGIAQEHVFTQVAVPVINVITLQPDHSIGSDRRLQRDDICLWTDRHGEDPHDGGRVQPTHE
jgi:hypothetical protein